MITQTLQGMNDRRKLEKLYYRAQEVELVPDGRTHTDRRRRERRQMLSALGMIDDTLWDRRGSDRRVLARRSNDQNLKSVFWKAVTSFGGSFERSWIV